MDIPGFSDESLKLANELLYAESRNNPYLGKCGQKELREQNKTDRTPAQQAADKQKSQAQTGKTLGGSSASRSEAAKRAAETRAKCKGLR